MIIKKEKKAEIPKQIPPFHSHSGALIAGSLFFSSIFIFSPSLSLLIIYI